MKLMKRIHSKVMSHLKGHYKKVRKACAKHGMFLEITCYTEMVDLYFMIGQAALHLSFYKKPTCLISFTVNFDGISMVLLNCSASLSYLHY